MAILDHNNPLVDPAAEDVFHCPGHGRSPFSRADDDDPPEAFQIILDTGGGKDIARQDQVYITARWGSAALSRL
jgi:hypothetical protein